MKKHSLISSIITLLWLSLSTLATAGTVQLFSQIDQQEIYPGQPFTLTITIEGADNIEQPQQVQFDHFTTQFRGQSQNSSTIINNFQRTTSTTIELRYQLTLQDNTTQIPSVTIVADGVPYTTQPIPITVKKPEENDHFKLEVRLSKPVAYVGEPLLMTTTWLIGQKTRGGAFNLPILSDPRFKTSSRTDLLPQNKKQLIQIELANETILAKQYPQKVGDRDGLAITFFHTIIPLTTGDISLPQGTIALSALSGYKTPQPSRSYDPFGRLNRQQEIYSTLVIPANPVRVKVLPLPDKGKPAPFSGLVGNYTIEATASPTTVNVGDPISLQLTIRGETAQRITMPPLAVQDFKISSEPAKKHVADDAVTFTTTIRAEHEQVSAIPPIPLNFFNVETGRYETSTTQAIPITVRATRIITAADAQGGATTLLSQAPSPKEEVHQGIHYNYSDIHAQTDPTSNRLILWLTLLLPPGLFLLTVFLRRDNDKEEKAKRRRKKRALKQLKKNLHAASEPAFFDCWLTFLADELHRPPQSITVQDILSLLDAQPELSQQVQAIFRSGDAIKYGGKHLSLSQDNILETARKLHEVLS